MPQLSGTPAPGPNRFIWFAGKVALGYDTTDANANALIIALPDGDATDVPVLVLGAQNILGVDLGFFNGLTQPGMAVIDADADSWVMLGFNGDDDAQILLGGSAALTLPAFKFGGPVDANQNDITNIDVLNVGPEVEITLDINGHVARTQMMHRVDTFEDAASDTLDSLTGGSEGDIVILRASNAGRDVIIANLADGSANDNFRLAANFNFTLNDGNAALLCVRTINSEWQEFGRCHSGGVITELGSLHLKEKAAATDDSAAYGQFWVKDDNPSVPKFTDGDGADFDIVTSPMTQGLKAKRTAVGAGDYNPSALTTDYIIAVDNTAAARAVTISTEDVQSGSATNPRIMIVKDESGGANLNNITVSLESGNLDGVASYVITENYNSISVYLDGTNGFII